MSYRKNGQKELRTTYVKNKECKDFRSHVTRSVSHITIVIKENCIMEGFELIIVLIVVCVICYFVFTSFCKFLVNIRNSDKD